MTIGVDAKMPKALAPLSGKRHFTFSCDTVCELIGDWLVARVFDRSWLCAGHVFAAHSGGGCPTGEPGSPADGDAARPATTATATATVAMATATAEIGQTAKDRFIGSPCGSGSRLRRSGNRHPRRFV